VRNGQEEYVNGDKGAVIFPLALIISACATTADPDVTQAAQCMADVLKIAPTVRNVSTGARYSWRGRQHEAIITYGYIGSDGRSRSVTFEVGKAIGEYAYFWYDAIGGDEEGPLTQNIANAWYDRCKADAILISM